MRVRVPSPLLTRRVDTIEVMRYRLSDVNPQRLSLCKKGANGKRFFLRKAHGDTADQATLERELIVKSDWSAVYCIVAEPGAVENGGLLAPGDEDVWQDEVEIRKACHRFARNGGAINLDHKDAFGGTMVENAIAHSDFTVQSPDGALHTIRKGSWYVAIEPDAALRDAIEKGEVTGVSLEGDGLRTPLSKDTITTADTASGGAVGPSVICPKCKKKVPASKSTCASCGRDVSKLKNAFARNRKQPVQKQIDEALLAPCPDHSDGWCGNCAGTGQVPASQTAIQKAADDTPDKPIPDKPGVNNWIDKYGPDLPPYFKKVAEDINAKVNNVGKAIQLTWGTLRNWAEGKGNVTSSTRAKAAGALSDLHRMQAAAHAGKLVKARPPRVDPEELAAVQRSLEAPMHDRTLLHKIAAKLGIEKEAAEDENVPTFEDIIVARELNDELPDAFDALQQAIYLALSPSAGGDPVAIIQESLDEFGTWASGLVQRLQGGNAASKESLAKQLARLHGEDADEMTDEQYAKLLKAQEDGTAATGELVGLIREMVERQDKRLTEAEKKGGDGGEGGKEQVQKSEDELRADLQKALDSYEKQGQELDALRGQIETLAKGQSTQREQVAKSNGASDWGGAGIMFGG